MSVTLDTVMVSSRCHSPVLWGQFERIIDNSIRDGCIILTALNEDFIVTLDTFSFLLLSRHKPVVIPQLHSTL